MMRTLSLLLIGVIVLSLFASCDSTEPEPNEAVLVNQTGGPILYALPGKEFVGPPGWPSDTIEVDFNDPPEGLTIFVEADGSSALGDCELPDTYESRSLYLWDIDVAEDGQSGTAHLTATLSSEDYIDELQDNDCRLVLDGSIVSAQTTRGQSVRR